MIHMLLAMHHVFFFQHFYQMNINYYFYKLTPCRIGYQIKFKNYLQQKRKRKLLIKFQFDLKSLINYGFLFKKKNNQKCYGQRTATMFTLEFGHVWTLIGNCHISLKIFFAAVSCICEGHFTHTHTSTNLLRNSLLSAHFENGTSALNKSANFPFTYENTLEKSLRKD